LGLILFDEAPGSRACDFTDSMLIAAACALAAGPEEGLLSS
jgi:hypothetical protein